MDNKPWTIEDRLAYLEHRLAVLDRMVRLNRLITSTLDLHRLLDIITEAAAELVNTEAAAIVLLDKNANELHFETASGPKKDEIKRFAVALEDSVAGWVMTHNKPVIIRNAQDDPRHSRLVDAKTGFQTRALMEAPLTIHGETIGVIMAVNYSGEEDFGDEALQILIALAAQAAIAIENARLFEAQMQAYAAMEKANYQLQEIDRLKSAFIGVITHELRTPIANLDFSLQLLERYGIEDWSQEQREQLALLKEGITSTEHVVDNLVSFATYLSKRVELYLEWVDLGGVIDDTIQPLRSLAQSKNIAFHTEISSGIPKVRGDRERLSDAVHHLVQNALKFTNPGGSIWVRCWAGLEQIHFEVQDTGIGIPAGRMSELWEGFAQMADPVHRGVEGLGLGLALVKFIVSAHGGQVRAESVKDVGSIFGFEIPQGGPEDQVDGLPLESPRDEYSEKDV